MAQREGVRQQAGMRADGWPTSRCLAWMQIL